jgi:hydroxymethylglutaryl-CoA lyase
MSDYIEIRDVCPRDGFQDFAGEIPSDQKVAIIKRIAQAGIRSVEASSFVSPKAVPALADAEAVFASLDLGDVLVGAFVATRSGAERALAAGARELSTTIPATDGMTEANFRRDRATMLGEVKALATEYGSRSDLSVTIAAAFGCPFDGRVSPDEVVRLAEQLADAGYKRILLGDTIGVANPTQVAELYVRLTSALDGITFGAHFHDARGAGIANVVAAVAHGATLVDGALAGMGGCPFAPGAAGNVATEDVAWLLADLGYAIDPDLRAIAEAAAWLETELDLPLRGRVARARRFDWEDAVSEAVS